jgi:outer membrane lipoprotein-sorting protein
MMKKYAILGLAIALVVSIAAVGCGSKKSTHRVTPTPTHVATQTATPTAEPTEEPGVPGELPENYQFSMEWSDSEGNSGEMQYWVKVDKWRTDWSATQDGTASEFKMIYDGQFVYYYMPDAGQAFKYTPSEAMANPGEAYAQEFEDDYYGDVSDATMLAAFEAACPGGASIDGNEEVNGIPCTRFTCNFDGGVSTNWISDSGWPVKVETTVDGKTTTVQYSDIDFNAIDDSIFDINTAAPGVTVTEI